jgi:predicted HicB family RNase H-like nuclease
MKKIVSIRLPEDLHYELKIKTTKEKISIQELIEKFIKEYLDNENKKEKEKV